MSKFKVGDKIKWKFKHESWEDVEPPYNKVYVVRDNRRAYRDSDGGGYIYLQESNCDYKLVVEETKETGMNTETKFGPWKIWNGESSEAPTDKKVQVQFRDESRIDAVKKFAGDSGYYRWSYFSNLSDIIAYREVLEPVVVEREFKLNYATNKNKRLFTFHDRCGQNLILTVTETDGKIDWSTAKVKEV